MHKCQVFPRQMMANFGTNAIGRPHRMTKFSTYAPATRREQAWISDFGNRNKNCIPKSWEHIPKFWEQEQKKMGMGMQSRYSRERESECHEKNPVLQ